MININKRTRAIIPFVNLKLRTNVFEFRRFDIRATKGYLVGARSIRSARLDSFPDHTVID